MTTLCHKLRFTGLFIVMVALGDAGTTLQTIHGAQSADPAMRLRQGLEAYEAAVAARDEAAAQTLYRESLAAFESVIADNIENGHLYYNAGNAAFRCGQLGRAIAYYRKAESLLPHNRDVSRNLEFARRTCDMQIARAPGGALWEWVTFWHRESSTRTRWIVGIAAYAAFWTLLAVRLIHERPQAWVGRLATVAAAVALIAGGSVAYDEWRHDRRTTGVVIQDGAVLRKGNGAAYEPRMEQPLPDGVEFAVLETRDSSRGDRWYRVELPDGTDGWLSAERVLVF